AVIQGQSAGGDKTVNVKMVVEGLVPGMQHGDDSDSSLKTRAAKLKERFADGFKQKSEQNLFAGEDQAVENVRQGKDDMEIAHRQELRGLLFEATWLWPKIGTWGSGGYGRSYSSGAQSHKCRTA